MPAVIFGERFRGRGVPAWHGIGQVFNDDPTVSEAFQAADMFYTVMKTPLQTVVPGVGTFDLDGQFAIFRSGTATEVPAILGTVGREYEPIQNQTLAEAIDGSGLLAQYQVETVGALGNGETVFVALSERDGEFEIAGSPVQSYWTVANGHVGNRALSLMWTPVKTVCSNTLVMATRAATINAKISHGSGTEQEFKFWLSIAPRLRAAQQHTRELMQGLANFRVTQAEVDAIITAAYPRPQVTGKAKLAQVASLDLPQEQQDVVEQAVEVAQRAALRQWEKAQLVQDVFASYADSAGEQGQAGTAWGVYEAVVDVEDHREASRVTENTGVSALFGPRAKTKQAAFAAALQVAGLRG